MKRTKQQCQANALDRQLHTCRLGAEVMPFLPWTVRLKIQEARLEVRRFMHPKDKNETECA